MGPGAFPPPFGFGGMYQYLCLRGGGGVGVIFVCCLKKHKIWFSRHSPPQETGISLFHMNFLLL